MPSHLEPVRGVLRGEECWVLWRKHRRSTFGFVVRWGSLISIMPTAFLRQAASQTAGFEQDRSLVHLIAYMQAMRLSDTMLRQDWCFASGMRTTTAVATRPVTEHITPAHLSP